MPPNMGGMNTQRTPQRPRDYAAAILAATSREQRNQILDSCPEQLRDLVRGHVQALWPKVQKMRKQQVAVQQHEQLYASSRPEQKRSEFKKAPQEVGHEHLSRIRAHLKAQQGS